MKKTEQLLESIGRITRETGIPRTIFAVCPNSVAVTKAAFRAARRNNAPIYFAATLNQIDVDGGYTGMTPADFVRMARLEAEAIIIRVRPSSPSTTAVRGSRTGRPSSAGRPRRP